MLQLNLDWTRDRKLVTLFGADARVRRVGYENQLRAPATRQVNHFSQVDLDESAAAPYIQQVYEATPRLTLTPARVGISTATTGAGSPRVLR